MRRIAELVDRRHRIDPVAAVDQNPRVEAREAIGNADLKKGVRLYITNADGSRFVVVKSK